MHISLMVVGWARLMGYRLTVLQIRWGKYDRGRWWADAELGLGYDFWLELKSRSIQ